MTWERSGVALASHVHGNDKASHKKDSAFYSKVMKDMIESDIKNSKVKDGNSKEAEIEDIARL